MRRILFGSALFLAATVSGHAGAQGVFDMGNLSATLAIPATPGSPAPAPAPAAVPESALGFKPSPEVRKRNYAQFVDKLRASSPQGADEMQKLFAQKDVIAEFGTALTPYGLRTDNIADAYTVYWLNAWMASRGRSDPNTPEQAQGVRRQAANAMRANPQVAKLTDAQKQEMAEALLIQAMMLDAAMTQAKTQPDQMPQIQAGARAGAKAMSLDLDQMELTATGFVAAKR